MVAETIKLPNIRKIFIPDPGMLMFEVDLERADAHVVGWEANDETLKSIFRRRADIHTENALALFGGPGPLKKGEPGYGAWDIKRQKAKVGVHAVDYGCKEKTLAEHLNTTTADAKKFIQSWFKAHPKIEEWHRRVEFDLITRHCVENAWGYKRHYFDRIDDLLPEALAWIGQSTVAITINKALERIDEDVREAEILLQVHDSILGQVSIDSAERLIPQIVNACQVPIPYADPLIIPVDVKVSTKSWGDVVSWEKFVNAKTGSGPT